MKYSNNGEGVFQNRLQSAFYYWVLTLRHVFYTPINTPFSRRVLWGWSYEEICHITGHQSIPSQTRYINVQEAEVLDGFVAVVLLRILILGRVGELPCKPHFLWHQ